MKTITRNIYLKSPKTVRLTNTPPDSTIQIVVPESVGEGIEFWGESKMLKLATKAFIIEELNFQRKLLKAIKKGD